MPTVLLYLAKLINRLFSSAFQRRSYFNAWLYIYRLGLTGMGRIQGNPIEKNGELEVMRHVANQTKDRLVVFDVGANVGQYAGHLINQLQSHALDIHMFEPSSVNADLLRGMFQHNSAGHHSLFINQSALGVAPSEAYLYADQKGSDIASLHDLKVPIRPFQESEKEWVRVDSIDNYCEVHAVSHIDLLKIDVEGGEFDVLKGSMGMIGKNAIRYIQFEFGAGNISSRVFFRDFWDLLSDRYHFNQVVSGGLIPVENYSNEWEIFRTTNYLLVQK